ncbi:hypothetical protein BA896_023155 [Janthinobacterium lividum]|uniref:Uncharacterized protein n=1 Tax=Janthinobacterium lividum TaxID=29581 RepID=A0A1E8PMZ5_9BURK|nr:hypothetical protein BA896_023155 [Janthinobacterium lividum]
MTDKKQAVTVAQLTIKGNHGKNAIDALLLETRRRQRRKTDLSEFDTTLKEMMDLDISLPVILTWLEKQEKQTTLPALRRYIRRVFGEEFYDRFLLRNGWQRTKQEEKKRVLQPIQ